MDMNFLSQVPRGPMDKPILLLRAPEMMVDNEDPDGQVAMLERDFSGCIPLSFSKPVDQGVPGQILLDGRPVQYFHRFLNYAGGISLVGARVYPYLDKYDCVYTLHVEGFTDTDGNQMEPKDILLRTPAKVLPDPSMTQRDKLALRAAEEGIVLMRNHRNALPLAPGVLNVFGSGLHMFRSCGVGAGKINSRYTVGLKRAIRESADYALNEELADFYKDGDEVLPSEELLASAREKSDTAVIVLTRFGGENTDCSTAKGEYCLSDGEEQMVKTVTQWFSHTVVVLNTPCPMDVGFCDVYGVDALVYCGFAGMLGGQALLRVLSGEVNPSGKLTDTWAKRYEDIPASRNFYDCAKDGPRYGADTDVWLDTAYEEDIYVGYRYFDTFHVQPAYCFGHGLSYTTFSVETERPHLGPNNSVSLKVRVRNIGDRSGKETVQIYIGKPSTRLEHPIRELAEFGKTKLLAPGEEQTLSFQIPLAHLASYDEARAVYFAEEGNYRVYAGNSLATASLAGCFVLPEEMCIKQVKNRMQPVEPLRTLSQADPGGTWPQGRRSGIKADAQGIAPRRLVAPYTPTMRFERPESPITYRQMLDDPSLIPAYAAQLTVPQLCRLTVCGKAGWNMAGVGISGVLAVPEGTDVEPFAVADGNSGVRVDPRNTGFPSTVVYCATFDRDLIRQIGSLLGQEAKERGVSIITGPGLNIHRNPLNGRNPEYFSEDPYLAGVLSGSLAEGMEAAGVGANYKHFLGNNCETSRKRNQSLMTERALREIYLRAFEYALEVCPAMSIMTSYNGVNGRHTAADGELLRGILREEHEYQGFIMTDWNSYDSCDIVEMVLAGNNWITPGTPDGRWTTPLEEAVADGRLPEEVLRESVCWLLKGAAWIWNKQNTNN